MTLGESCELKDERERLFAFALSNFNQNVMLGHFSLDVELAKCVPADIFVAQKKRKKSL